MYLFLLCDLSQSLNIQAAAISFYSFMKNIIYNLISNEQNDVFLNLDVSKIEKCFILAGHLLFNFKLK